MLCPTGVLRLLRLQNLIAVCFPPAPNLLFSSLPWGLDRSRSTVWLAGQWTDTRMGQRIPWALSPLPLFGRTLDSLPGVRGLRDRNPRIP